MYVCNCVLVYGRMCAYARMCVCVYVLMCVFMHMCMYVRVYFSLVLVSCTSTLATSKVCLTSYSHTIGIYHVRLGWTIKPSKCENGWNLQV